MNLRELVEMSREVFEDLSKNQRQRLVYVLLNAARAEDRQKFLWYLERALAAKIGSERVGVFVREVRDALYPPEGESTLPFPEIAHAIVLGVLEGGRND